MTRAGTLTLVTMGMLFLCIGAWTIGDVTTNQHEKRAHPSVEKSGLQLQIHDWQGGKVGYIDHSKTSSSYDWRLEWHGPAGERTELLKVGNESPPHYEIGEDKSLKIPSWGGKPVIFDSPGKQRE